MSKTLYMFDCVRLGKYVVDDESTNNQIVNDDKPTMIQIQNLLTKKIYTITMEQILKQYQMDMKLR